MTRTHETPKQAARRLAAGAIRDGFQPQALHEYCDPDGNPLFWRIRLKHPDSGEKWIRPMKLNGQGYILGEPEFPNGKPLYRLDDLAISPAEDVYVAEGETCANALMKLGLLATTSGAADSAGKADWTMLSGRIVTIWPDNDEAGRHYAEAVAEILLGLGCTVRMIDVAALNLPPKGDVVDWLAAHAEARGGDITALSSMAMPRSLESHQDTQPAEGIPTPSLDPDIEEPGMGKEQAPYARPSDGHASRQSHTPEGIAPPAYPLDALGGILGDAARAIAEGAQLDPAIAGQSILGAAALAAQQSTDVLTATGRKPLSLYLLTSALSGDGKSAADGPALAPIRDLERRQWREYEAERTQWENTTKQERGDRPINPLRLVADFTAEGLIRQYREGLPSLGAFSDEAGAVFGGHGFTKEKKLATAAALSSLWDGQGIRARARASDERGGLEARFNVWLSAHWLIQPAAVHEAINDSILGEQGFWPRVLLATPAPGEPRQYRPFRADQDPAIGRYWGRLADLLRQPVTAHESRPALALSQPAESLVSQFFEAMDKACRRTNGRYAPIRSWGSRATEQVCRIAGVLTVFERGHEATIELEEVTRAAALVAYSLDSWLYMLERKPEADAHAYAERLLNWLKKQPGQQSDGRAMLTIGPKPRSAGLRDSALAILSGEKRVANMGGGTWVAV